MRMTEKESPETKKKPIDIKECARLNDSFIVRKTDKKHTVRQIGTLAIIAMGAIAACWYIMMLFFRVVV